MFLLALMVLAGVDESHIYVPTAKQRYLDRQGEFFYFGSVAESGEFEIDFGVRPLSVRGMVGGSTPHLRAPRWENEPVFEYRYGRLIPGRLSLHGVFMPDIGGVIVDFALFKQSHSRGDRRVYNLPGKFVTKAVFQSMKTAGRIPPDAEKKP